MASQRPLIEKYWALASQEIFDFKNGNAIVGAGWPYQVSSLKASHFTIGSVVPSEGATGWADTWMLAAKAPHPNCAYMWMNWITNPDIQAQVAEWFGEAPANTKACALTVDKNHCATYHANDETYFKRIWFWTTPQSECLDGRTDVTCKPYSEWAQAWSTLRNS